MLAVPVSLIGTFYLKLLYPVFFPPSAFFSEHRSLRALRLWWLGGEFFLASCLAYAIRPSGSSSDFCVLAITIEEGKISPRERTWIPGHG